MSALKIEICEKVSPRLKRLVSCFLTFSCLEELVFQQKFAGVCWHTQMGELDGWFKVVVELWLCHSCSEVRIAIFASPRPGGEIYGDINSPRPFMRSAKSL